MRSKPSYFCPFICVKVVIMIIGSPLIFTAFYATSEFLSTHCGCGCLLVVAATQRMYSLRLPLLPVVWARTTLQGRATIRGAFCMGQNTMPYSVPCLTQRAARINTPLGDRRFTERKQVCPRAFATTHEVKFRTCRLVLYLKLCAPVPPTVRDHLPGITFHTTEV